MQSGIRFDSVCAYTLLQIPSDAPGGPTNRNRRPGEPGGYCERRSLRLGFPAAVALANGADFLWGRPVGAVPIRSRFLAFCRSFGSCFVFFRAFAFEGGPEEFRRYFDRERSLPFSVAVRKLFSYRSAVSRRSSLPRLSVAGAENRLPFARPGERRPRRSTGLSSGFPCRSDVCSRDRRVSGSEPGTGGNHFRTRTDIRSKSTVTSSNRRMKSMPNAPSAFGSCIASTGCVLTSMFSIVQSVLPTLNRKAGSV